MKQLILIAAIILMAGTVYAGDPNDMPTPTRAGQSTYCVNHGVIYIQYMPTNKELHVYNRTSKSEFKQAFLSLWDSMVRDFRRNWIKNNPVETTDMD
jgi:uncharacterized protein